MCHPIKGPAVAAPSCEAPDRQGTLWVLQQKKIYLGFASTLV